MNMRQTKMRNLFGVMIALICLVLIPLTAQAAKPVKANKVTKERLVLMPLRVAEEDKSLQGAMETALVQGLQLKYEVFSGERVTQKAHQIYMKEQNNANTAHKDCDETRCMQNIAEAFQAELIATAYVTKREDGYFLALSVKNIFDNLEVYSNTTPCKNCDAYQVVDKLKELSGVPAEEPQAKVNLNDPDGALWAEAEKGDSLEDYRVYLDTYPKGKYVPFAKAHIKKLKDSAQARVEQQEQRAWTTAQQDKSVASYALYLKDYPKGRYAGLAKARVEKIKNELASQQRSQVETQHALPDCIFPNSSDAAPGWVCDAPVEGYELTIVGSASITSKYPGAKLPPFQTALLDATVQLAQRMKVKRANAIKKYQEEDGEANSETADKVNTSVTKQITSIKIGSNISVTAMIKQYFETTGEVGNTTLNQVNTSVSKLVMDHPCAYTMKNYIEIAGEGESQTVDAASDEAGKQCTIKDVTRELASAGLDVVNTVKSPQGDRLFLLLGAKKVSELKTNF